MNIHFLTETRLLKNYGSWETKIVEISKKNLYGTLQKQENRYQFMLCKS